MGVRFLLGALFVCNLLVVKANMAEPIDRGTLATSPFLNQYVDILHEDIYVTLDSEFKKANYEIVYNIKAQKEGVNIPFLFYASEVEGNFKVTIDGKPLEISQVPDLYVDVDSTEFRDFSYFFSTESFDDHENKRWVHLDESEDNDGFYITLDDFLFFETDILEGEHQIRVTYTATSWRDGWNWVNEYSFRYALSPAKYWKSFGSLTITLDATKYENKLSTTIGEPTSGKIDSIATWKFDSLPSNMFNILYIPEISSTAQTFINIGSTRFKYVLTVLLVVLHILFIFMFRKRKPKAKFSWIVLLGSLIIPFVYLSVSIFFYSYVDDLIGEHTSGTHGYAGIEIILYPLLMPIYFLFAWLVDRWIKNKSK